MTGPADRRVLLPGGPTLRIREWPGSGPGLLLLHGFLGSAESWGVLPGRLEGVRVVAVDLPGHGGSREVGPGDCAVPRMVELLGRLQEAVFDAPPAWLGYSMGARIALAAAVEGVPGPALLLESGSPGLADPVARAERRLQDEEKARRLEDEGIEAFVDEWLRLPLFQGLLDAPPEVQAAARATRIAQDPARMAACLREGGTGVQPSCWDRLSEIRRPVRLVVGVKDRKFVTVARAMVDRLPDVALREIPGSGHTVHLEAPERWLRWVRDVLSEVHPPGPSLPASPEP